MKPAHAVIAVLVLVGCARSLPEPYMEERAAAERAYSSGRYEEAAEHWQLAARAADTKRDRNEARYRAAVSLHRAGRREEAAQVYESMLRDSPKTSRAARATYDLADLTIERGDAEKGYAALEAALLQHPESGVARGALLRYLAWLEARGGAEAALNWLDRTAKKLDRSELAQHIYYARARYLEKLGRLGDARTQFLEIARRFPYPQGTVWDDSLFAASLLDERLGNSRAAVADLERMLKEREPSHIQGSYERPLYAQARFRIALLYRDRFSDPARARREFRRVFDEHRTSLLRDDALWNEALLAKKSEGASATCPPLKLLVDDLPDSRYVPCAHELCSELKPVPGRTCRDYILRAMKNGQPPELPSMPTLYSSSSSR